MSSFTFIGVLLLGVIISNTLKEFFPKISETFILIGVGIIISFFPNFKHFELEPEFFMLGIIAPLMFYEGKKISFKVIKKKFSGIFFLSITLSLITALLVTLVSNQLMPHWSIPLAVCFAAIVTPTDSAAVTSIIATRKIPKGVNDAMEFESLFNDAIGLVLLSLGLSVLQSGHFSVWVGLERFAFVSFGGILIGIILGILLVRIRSGIYLRAMNPEATIIPISLVTPFLVYICAESLGTSGILAVVVAGLVHNLEEDVLKLSATNVQLTNMTIWKILNHMLTKFVFILLGVSFLPIWSILYNLGFNETIILFIVGISVYVLVLVIRKTITSQKNNASLQTFFSQDNYSRKKESTIFALSGAHGTVTLAMAFSLPIDSSIISTQNRDILITLSAMVIILSMIVPTIILPKILPEKKQISSDINKVRNDMVDYAIVHVAQKVPDPLIRRSFVQQLQSQKGLKFSNHKQSKILLSTILDQQESLLNSTYIKKMFSKEVITYYKDHFRAKRKKSFLKSIQRYRKVTRASSTEFSKMATARKELIALADRMYFYAMEELDKIEKERWKRNILDFSDIDEVKQVLGEKYTRTRRDLQEEILIPDNLIISGFQAEFNFVQNELKENSLPQDIGNELIKEITNAQILQLQRSEILSE